MPTTTEQPVLTETLDTIESIAEGALLIAQHNPDDPSAARLAQSASELKAAWTSMCTDLNGLINALPDELGAAFRDALNDYIGASARTA